MNTKKIILVLAVILVIIIAVGVISIFLNQPRKQGLIAAEGLHISAPRVNAQTSSPITIAGRVNGGGWAGFEGQVGTVTLIDPQGRTIGQSTLTATTDWKKKDVEFETQLSVESDFKGPAILFFHNENPSGDAEKDKEIAWPVFIK